MPSTTRSKLAAAITGLIVSVSGSTLLADVKPAAMFSDHMVLQQGMPLPVWGVADAGEAVSVSLGAAKATATAGADGKWMVKLPAAKGSMDAVELTIAGKNSITIKDVLIGEVWLGSGQSNMQFTVSKARASFAGLINEEQEIAAANYPKIRMFTAKSAKTYEPQLTTAGAWELCTPETVPGWSAVGYLFARDLQKELNVPVGILTSAFGASVAEAWISRETLTADPKLKFMVDRFDEDVKYFKADPRPPADQEPKRPTPINKARPAPRALAAAAAAPAAPAVAAAPANAPAANAATPATNPAGRGARAGGRGGRGGGGGLSDPVQDQHMPTVLYNGMIKPLVPYAMRGALWYQGESICYGTPGLNLYGHVMQTLVNDWRKQWGQGDFTFLEVQLPGQQNISNNPRIREEQMAILSMPNTGMAVTIDIGEAKDVHPHNKAPLGERLTKLALATAYGKQIEANGPMFEAMKVDGNAARISFTHLGGGLVGKGGALKGFMVAGEDKNFVPADAKVEGNSIVVTSADVKSPVAVRYAWDNFPEGMGCNLYNVAGIPAAPFRTDKWDVKIEGIVED